MKKVLIFSTAYLPLIGGAEIAVKEITDRVLDYEFDLITARIDKNLSREEKIGRVNIYRVGFGTKFDKFLLPVLGVLKALSLSRKNKYSFIWSIMASQGGMAALFFKYLTAKPFILTLQEGDSEKHILNRVGVFYPLWKRIFRKADCITVISKYLKDFALRHGARCTIDVISNGVDIKKFTNQFNEIEKNNFKKDLGLSVEDRVVVTVSRLVYKNGVDILTESMKDVEARLLIVGDGEDKEKLEKIVKDNNLENKVFFVGKVDPEEVPKYLWISDVFVRASRSEGFGNVFIEAMAASVPVIASNAGGISDFLKDGENGVASSFEDLASDIKYLLNDKKLRDKLIVNGLKTADLYNWDIKARDFKVLFSGFLNRKKVLLAAGIYPPDAGGPATYIKKLEDYLKNNLWDVSVVTYGKENVRKIGFKVVSRDGLMGWRQFKYSFYLLRESRGKDFIYAFDLGSSGLAAYIVSLLTFKPLVLRIGGDLLWESKALNGYKKTMDDFYGSGEYKGFKFFIMRLIIRRAKVIFVPTQSLVDIYKKYYGVEGSNLKILPNVIEKQDFQKKNSSTKKILFAGRFVAYKNLDLLLNIAKDLEYEFYIVGSGPEREKLEKFVKYNNLENRVYIYDNLKRDDLYDLIKSCDLGISLSLVEYNPNFILECLSFGLPVILNESNGLTVKLSQEFLVNVKDKKEVEEKINYILGNYDKALDKVSDSFKSYSFKESMGLFLEAIENKKIC